MSNNGINLFKIINNRNYNLKGIIDNYDFCHNRASLPCNVHLHFMMVCPFDLHFCLWSLASTKGCLLSAVFVLLVGGLVKIIMKSVCIDSPFKRDYVHEDSFGLGRVFQTLKEPWTLQSDSHLHLRVRLCT